MQIILHLLRYLSDPILAALVVESIAGITAAAAAAAAAALSSLR
jgi:hypothetical protein